MEPVLPKFLLFGAVEEGEVADMVDEDEAQDGQLAVDRGHLAKRALEGRAKALQGGGGVELVDLKLDLPRDEFALQICHSSCQNGLTREGGMAYSVPAFQ